MQRQPSARIPTTTGRISLSPGQVSRHWLPAGTTLVASAPYVVVTPATRWIAGHMLDQSQRVNDGQSLMLDSGWVQIEAPEGGEVLTLTPASMSWLGVLAGVVRRLRARHRPAPCDA